VPVVTVAIQGKDLSTPGSRRVKKQRFFWSTNVWVVEVRVLYAVSSRGHEWRGRFWPAPEGWPGSSGAIYRPKTNGPSI